MLTKICTKCGIEKSLSEFHKLKFGKYGVNSVCKECIKLKNPQNKIRIENYYKKYPWLQVLTSINQRCNNPKSGAYRKYGKKNIKNYLTKAEIKELWFRDRAYKMNWPSVDRKNSKKDYIFDNCQFIEHSENSAKEKRKKVCQFDLQGNFIREWESMLYAQQKTGIWATNISKCCRDLRPYAGGFTWRYKDE